MLILQVKSVTLKLTLTVLLTLILLFPGHSQTFTWQWVEGAVHPSPSSSQDICHDPNSNSVYLVGYFHGNLSGAFGPAFSSPYGNSDAYLAKYSSTGVFQWAVKIGGSGDDEAHAVTVNSAGEVIVGGFFTGSANFQGTSGSNTVLSSSGDTDFFIAKYSSAGVLSYARKGGSTKKECVLDLYADGTTIYAAGYFEENITYVGMSLINDDKKDAFALRIDNSGNPVWFRGGGTDQEDEYTSVTMSGTHVFFGGNFRGSTFSFYGTGMNSTSNAENGKDDGILVKYNASNGNYVASSLVSGNDEDRLYGLTSDATKLYFTGSTKGSLFFNGTYSTNNNNTETYIAACDLNFIHSWNTVSDHFNAAQTGGYGVSIDNSGTLYATGFFDGSIYFGGESF